MGNPVKPQFSASGADPMQLLIQEVEHINDIGRFQMLPYVLGGAPALAIDRKTGQQERILEIAQVEFPVVSVIGGLAVISDAGGHEKFYEVLELKTDAVTKARSFRRGAKVADPLDRIFKIVQAHVTPEDIAHQGRAITDSQRNREIIARIAAEEKAAVKSGDGLHALYDF